MTVYAGAPINFNAGKGLLFSDNEQELFEFQTNMESRQVRPGRLCSIGGVPYFLLNPYARDFAVRMGAKEVSHAEAQRLFAALQESKREEFQRDALSTS